MTQEMVATPIEPYHRESVYLPVMQAAQVAHAMAIKEELILTVFKEGRDFGNIPGVKKPSLLKPGAEKARMLFGLSVGFEIVSKIEDWTGEDHGGQPLFQFVYKCQLTRDGILIAEQTGEANSWEEKHRYRNSGRVCPSCGAEAISKSKAEWGGGWYCNAKRGGCGAKFSAGDRTIEGQEAGRVLNMEPFSIINTLHKMAEKRAFVGAILLAANLSDQFTQDVEDTVDAEADVTTQETKRRTPEPTPEPAKAKPNGEAKKSKPSLSERLAKAVECFEGVGVPLHTLQAALGKSPDAWNEVDLAELQGAWQALKKAAPENIETEAQLLIEDIRKRRHPEVFPEDTIREAAPVEPFIARVLLALQPWITREDLEAFYGVPADKWTSGIVGSLNQAHADLEAGTKTVDELFAVAV